MDARAVPTLPSRDLAETRAFYERLGFRRRGQDEEATGYLVLQRATIELHFFRDAGVDPLTTSAGCYVHVPDADALHAAWAAAGVPDDQATGSRLRPPVDTEHGLREFHLVDRSGNLLRVGSVPPPPAGEHVTLTAVDAGAVLELAELSVAPGQEPFVAANALTIAEAAYEPHVRLRAIRVGEAAVGLVALVPEEREPGAWRLARMMIAGDHQGQGLGWDALSVVIAWLRATAATALVTSYVPGAGDPSAFYHRAGFVETGEEEDGEVVLRLAL
jgi:GNAT superfamily N-acetyltransferase